MYTHALKSSGTIKKSGILVSATKFLLKNKKVQKAYKITFFACIIKENHFLNVNYYKKLASKSMMIKVFLLVTFLIGLSYGQRKQDDKLVALGNLIYFFSLKLSKKKILVTI